MMIVVTQMYHDENLRQLINRFTNICIRGLELHKQCAQNELSTTGNWHSLSSATIHIHTFVSLLVCIDVGSACAKVTALQRRIAADE